MDGVRFAIPEVRGCGQADLDQPEDGEKRERWHYFVITRTGSMIA